MSQLDDLLGGLLGGKDGGTGLDDILGQLTGGGDQGGAKASAGDGMLAMLLPLVASPAPQELDRHQVGAGGHALAVHEGRQMGVEAGPGALAIAGGDAFGQAHLVAHPLLVGIGRREGGQDAGQPSARGRQAGLLDVDHQQEAGAIQALAGIGFETR